MNLNLRIICWYIGVSLLLVSALMAVAGIIACITPGDPSAIILFYSALITGLLGVFPLIYVRKGKHKLTFKEGNCIVVISWILACILGMLPFLLYGDEFELVDALFESVSGFTTTGASILTDIESLPRGLQFWRIATAWVGGIGIVTLFSMIMMRRMDWSMLSRREISNVSGQAFKGERNGFFFHRTLVVYLLLTLATFISLMTTGMGWFDSLTNAMSACSTCGFCVRNLSIAYYDSLAVEGILTLAMLAAGMNFGILFLTFFRRSRHNIFRSETIRVFLAFVGIAVIAITVDLLVSGGFDSVGKALRYAVFQAVSISTTTGFATADTSLWPPLSMSVLIICSLICGCSGSTSGGIKIDRALLAMKGIRRRISTSLDPGIVKIVKVDGIIRSYEQVNDAMGYIFLYMLIIAAGTAVNLAGGLDFTTGFTASISCIGNVGPGFGDVGSMANYADLPALVKLSSMAEMLIGRLEIYPMLYFLSVSR
jgi:trk system potassium uptake protein TrkH